MPRESGECKLEKGSGRICNTRAKAMQLLVRNVALDTHTSRIYISLCGFLVTAYQDLIGFVVNNHTNMRLF